MLGVIIASVVLSLLVFKRASIIIVAPIAVFVLAIFSSTNPLILMEESFLPGLADFIKQYFLLFLLGSLLGQIMTDSQASAVIASRFLNLWGKKYIAAPIVIIGVILSYGGIPGHVVIFSLYSLGIAMFKETHVPVRLLLPCVSLGVSTSALAAPGSPQIHNLVISQWLGTLPTASPIFGITAGIITLMAGIVYLEKKISPYTGNVKHSEPAPEDISPPGCEPPTLLRSMMPLAVIFISINSVHQNYTLAVLLGVTAALAFLWHYLEQPFLTLNNGAGAALIPLFNAGSAVAYGAALKGVPSFSGLLLKFVSLDFNPTLKIIILVNIASCLVGSAMGGILITLSSTEQQLAYLGLNYDYLHRLIALSSIILDSTPYNSAYLILLSLTGLSHKETYKDFFIVTAIVPAVGLILGLFTLKFFILLFA